MHLFETKVADWLLFFSVKSHSHTNQACGQIERSVLVCAEASNTTVVWLPFTYSTALRTFLSVRPKTHTCKDAELFPDISDRKVQFFAYLGLDVYFLRFFFNLEATIFTSPSSSSSRRDMVQGKKNGSVAQEERSLTVQTRRNTPRHTRKL